MGTSKKTGTNLVPATTTPASNAVAAVPEAPLAPSAAVTPRDAIRWYQTYAGSAGAMVAAILVMPSICAEAMSIGAYVSGDIVGGTWAMLIAGVFGGGFVGLGKVGVRFDRRDNARLSAAYAKWSAWLQGTYGLVLDKAQNNALVNHDNWDGPHQREALMWGSTNIVHEGKPVNIKLVGDQKHGFQVLMQKGAEYVPLPKIQPSASPQQAKLPQPDIFPGYNRLPTKAMRRAVDALHVSWTQLNQEPLEDEDRYTLNAMATDYLPQSLMLLEKFTERNGTVTPDHAHLFLAQVAAMTQQLEQIRARVDQQHTARMKAHTIFLQQRAQE